MGVSRKKTFSKNSFGVSQYSGFKKPKKSFGSHLFKGSKKRYGYKTPGYGTKWGTNFVSGMGKYKGKGPRNGISKKALGLGVGAGFLGGAAAGLAGTMATYSVYHKYQEFRRRVHLNQMQLAGIGMDETGAPDVDWDDDYYQVLIIFSLCRYIYYISSRLHSELLPKQLLHRRLRHKLPLRVGHVRVQRGHHEEVDVSSDWHSCVDTNYAPGTGGARRTLPW